MDSPTVGLTNRNPGLREAFLLLVGAGFTSQMFNLPTMAITSGAAAVLVWAVSMLRPSRPGVGSTLALGAGLIVTFVWWPEEGASRVAISLMWIGVALALAALGRMIWERVRG